MAWASKQFVNSKTFTGTRVVRLAAIKVWLEYDIPWKFFNIVVYETPFVRGRDATRSLWGTAGILEAIATRVGLPIIDIAVPTIKKFATGNGKAVKDEMVTAARKFGYKGNSDHEADAVCLLNYTQANLEKGSG
jgi:Holliday junction resolvasome RuvABC endonuclease subunit